MSLLPAFKAILNDSLNDKQCQQIADKIGNMKGVLSATFNESSGKKEVWVTYDGAPATRTESAKIPGVQKLGTLM